MSVPAVILASGSRSRASLLRNAGVVFTQQPSAVDEDAIKAALRAQGATAAHCAEVLAEMKAVQVSRAHPAALVIGADQMLACEGVWFDKPLGLDGARAHLRQLRGRTHQLLNSLIVARGGARVWHYADHATMRMRPLSDAFVEQYLASAGAAILGSVGAYQLEGMGSQLFEAVAGDFFSILGLPLLPLLAFLREHGVVAS